MQDIITLKPDDEYSIFGNPYACINPKELLLTHFYNDIVNIVLEYFFDEQLKHILQLLSDLVFFVNGYNGNPSWRFMLDIYWMVKNYKLYVYDLFCGINRMSLSVKLKTNDIIMTIKNNNVDVIDENEKYNMIVKCLIEIKDAITVHFNSQSCGSLYMHYITHRKNNDIHIKFSKLPIDNVIPTKISEICNRVYNVLIKHKYDIPNTIINWDFVTHEHYNICYVNFIKGKYKNTTFNIDYSSTVKIRIYNPDTSYIMGSETYCRSEQHGLIKAYNYKCASSIYEFPLVMTNGDVDEIYDFLSGWIKQFE